MTQHQGMCGPFVLSSHALLRVIQIHDDVCDVLFLPRSIYRKTH